MSYFICRITPTRETFLSDATAAELELVGAHFNRLNDDAIAGKVFMAGRTLEGEAIGYVVLHADDANEATTYMEGDPAIVGGVFRLVDVFPFSLAIAGRKV